MEQIQFPKSGNQCIDTIRADVFQSPTCRYNIILGRDILDLMGFPKFGNQCIDTIRADVFQSPTCRYNIILGRDILDLMGAMINF